MRTFSLKIWSIVFLTALCCWSYSAFSQPLVAVKNEAYTAYYSLEYCVPVMVVYNLVPSDFVGNQKLRSRHFKVDTQLPPPRIKANALNGSGYVRGHLCAAADRDTDKGRLKQTYLTSNMAPMTMTCNSGAWKNLEDSCRYLAETHGSLTIIAGCLFPQHNYGLQWIGRVAIPTYFYRVAICNVHHGEMWCWICPNTLAASKPVRMGTTLLQQVIQPEAAATLLTRMIPKIYPR